MKVLLINGSAKENGCTFTALSEVERGLNESGVETEIISLGTKPIPDCMGCGKCREAGACVFGDIVNEIVEKAKTSDGFVFGSPVYYAHPSGRLLSVLDRVFYSGSKEFAFKPGAAVVSARRGGTTASLEAINKHFSINQMPIVTSNYWNMVHGNTPDEVRQDKEGMRTMYNLGRNMAWMIQCLQAGPAHPQNEKENTNFIR
ncbi:MAG: flavodoxin family protein [Eubacterium sp.]